VRTLGAVLAGGASRRFGSDKAVALLEGASLLDRAMAAIEPIGDAAIVVGRLKAGRESVLDWPEPGLGPLGGIAGALRHARDRGFDQLLSVPVDCVRLPANLLARLSPSPAYSADQPVIGLWPVDALPELEHRLMHGASRAVRAFAEAIGARQVSGLVGAWNINSRADLARLEADDDADGRDEKRE
jgi:molybdenum cofactor guanylyltransferase